jgi:hypothetical protein
MARFLMKCVGRAHSGFGRLLVLPLLAIGMVAFSSMANATILTTGACPPANPGDTVFPCDATASPTGTLLASLSAPFTSSLGTYSGTLISAVYREAGGTLDFYYQVINNTTAGNATGSGGCGHGGGQAACDPISRETDTNFSTWLTQLAFRTNGSGPFTPGTVPPVTGDRNSPGGDVIGFSFNPPDSAKILPGTTSNVLIISTNALFFQPGNASVIDGGVTTVASFQPGVPEPASIALVGFGLLALGGLRLRTKTRRKV